MIFDPLLELAYGIALHGKLDMRVSRLHLRTGGMSHERHANFLHDAGFHQPGIERMAEIVETYVADSGILKRGFPRAFDDAKGAIFVCENQAHGFLVFDQKLKQPVTQRNLARFAFRSL